MNFCDKISVKILLYCCEIEYFVKSKKNLFKLRFEMDFIANLLSKSFKENFELFNLICAVYFVIKDYLFQSYHSVNSMNSDNSLLSLTKHKKDLHRKVFNEFE